MLDPWQQYVLRQGPGHAGGDKWAAFEVGLIVARQNGKGTVLEALELRGAVPVPRRAADPAFGARVQDLAEAFLRVRALIEDNPDFDREVSQVIRTAAGAEAVELKDGKRLRFVARSSGVGPWFHR